MSESPVVSVQILGHASEIVELLPVSLRDEMQWPKEKDLILIYWMESSLVLNPQFIYDFLVVFVILNNSSSHVLFSHNHNNLFPDYNFQSVSYYTFDTTTFLQLHDED